jgi:transcriptional regulator with GAF, ATPase, and Fis domain
VVAPDASNAELAEVFADVARALLAEPTWEGVLTRICQVAVDVVPGCESASTSVVTGQGKRSRVETVASAGEFSTRVDALQYETGEGPCLEAVRQDEVFRTGDLSAEPRWPRFARRAAEETGIRSILAMRLYTGEDTHGALNLYSRRLEAFGEDARALGSVLAAHGAVAFAGARQRQQVETLRQGLASREIIGQAMGILMHKQRITADEAFAQLVRVSQHLNRKLRDVAEDLTKTGTDPQDV